MEEELKRYSSENSKCIITSTHIPANTHDYFLRLPPPPPPPPKKKGKQEMGGVGWGGMGYVFNHNPLTGTVEEVGSPRASISQGRLEGVASHGSDVETSKLLY